MVEFAIVGVFCVLFLFCILSYLCLFILVSARVRSASFKDMPFGYLFPWFCGEWQTLEDFIILTSAFWIYLGILFRFTAFRVRSQVSPGPSEWFQTIRKA